MLNREEADKRLAKFRIKDWSRRRLADFAKLPRRLAEAGRALLGRNADGKPFRDWEKREKAKEAAIASLEQMTAAERRRVFATLFPRLVRHLENAWQLATRLPYETEYDRKGFRAPNDPTAAREARGRWLTGLIDELEGYDEDIAWCAAWAAYLGGWGGADALGVLLAAAIDAGGTEGEAVFEVLRESGRNEHEIGSMGRHVTRALLVSSRPEGWEFIEKMLLAAQRQEGLRQVILETIDEAHPEAFRRMLRLILEHNLLRFSAAIRAADVWFGLAWAAASARVVRESLEQVLRFLEDPKARAEAAADGKGETLYLALWATAFEDAAKAVAPAARLFSDADVERRFVAARFLAQLGLPAARAELVRALADEDLRVAWQAFEGCADEGHDLFKPLEQLLGRLPPRPAELPALVWPWATTSIRPEDVADKLADQLGDRPVTALIPYLSRMGAYGRAELVDKLAKQRTWDAATRDTLFAMVGDRFPWVRERALEALKKCSVEEADARRLEGLLTRKNSDLRRAVLTLLKKQKTPAALDSSDRLLTSAKAGQRLAGLELLRLLVESRHGIDAARERARAYQERRRQPGEEELLQLEAILDVRRVVPVLDDALGLMANAQRSPTTAPRRRSVAFLTLATLACLKALDDLIHEHRGTPVMVKNWEGTEEQLLGNVAGWAFPSPQAKVPADKDAARLPLREVWEEWFAGRPAKLRDRDGLELVRALAWYGTGAKEWKQTVKRYRKDWGDYLAKAVNGLTPLRLRHEDLVGEVLAWLVRLHPPAGAADFLLDAIETAFALVPAKVLERVVDPSDWRSRNRDWRYDSPVSVWLQRAHRQQTLCPEAWGDEQRLRLWQLYHWRDEPVPGVARVRPDLDLLLAAFQAGAATEGDLLDQFLVSGDFDALGKVTSVPPPAEVQASVALAAVVDRCRARILEIELARGEMPTAASEPALALRSLHGTDTLLRVLAALGPKAFARRQYSQSRTEVLTHLVSITYPTEADTPEEFAVRMKRAGVTRERLLDLAFLAPQWVKHVEHALGWDGLAEGVWWFLAHTPSGRSGLGGGADADDDYDEDENEVEPAGTADPWERLLNERTPLTRAERMEGGVDVAWFRRAYEPLAGKRWRALGEASKYGCRDQGYKKARLISDVLLGRARKRDLVAGIRKRQLRESVRLLGLLPLARGERRDQDVQGRYRVLQEYRRYVRTLSPMSKEGALRTLAIGLENLARTSGYPDPVRLEWALEAREIADLAAGPLTASHQGVTVTLALDDEAQAQLTVSRGDRPLKSIPATVRKHPRIAALGERKAELKRQASRMRESLEAAMIRGDTFTGAELQQLFTHPILAPVLERLVLLGEGIRGYPVAGGRGLRDPAGKVEPVKKDEALRLAHPHDLLQAGDWHDWQHECFHAERVQPFKQVFRELYAVTAQERKDGGVSHRYAGQQVNPTQAMALFGTRGWGTRDGVSKTFHDAGLTAAVSFRSGAFTPLEVEGLTLEGVQFCRRGEWQPLPLVEVPPRLFSEVMRDVDLVVSVAHAGGVDPEASASTVEMRAALLRETCGLLGVGNYQLKGSHVLIAGKLGKYSVHLGSGVVHRMPGGSLCIVPVHAQQRGRLFLPFVDDDPRTAEVLSKVLLLARDHEIQDPSILEQLR